MDVANLGFGGYRASMTVLGTEQTAANGGGVLRVALIDDEPLARARLEQLMAADGSVRIVGQAEDVASGADLIARTAPDVVLLDIQMPGGDGLGLARTLEQRPDVGVIFVTAFDRFAVEAFEIDAIDYLLKPVGPERLASSLARARRWLAARRQTVAQEPVPSSTDGEYADCLWVQKKDGMMRVDLTTIDWIEAARDYVLLHTATRCHILRATMDGLARRLDPRTMVRVSRSAFVRADAVERLERQGRNSLVLALSDGAAVRVGATYCKAVETRFGS